MTCEDATYGHQEPPRAIPSSNASVPGPIQLDEVKFDIGPLEPCSKPSACISVFILRKFVSTLHPKPTMKLRVFSVSRLEYSLDWAAVSQTQRICTQPSFRSSYQTTHQVQ
ncbi:hypothetical protein N7G274_005135 [Stereocaulon virgatum]|uniref:Uncharacterized protein n=1 Tax=Stereocaulon virgatum TaxID=373712 RepID=A0ABR4A7R5_9LECA